LPQTTTTEQINFVFVIQCTLNVQLKVLSDCIKHIPFYIEINPKYSMFSAIWLTV